MKKLIAIIFLGLTMTATAGVQGFSCKLGRVQVNYDRMVIKCNYQQGNPAFVKDIPWFSASFTQKNATHLLNLAMQAKLNNKRVRVYWSQDPDNNPNGCKGGNCRRLNALGF